MNSSLDSPHLQSSVPPRSESVPDEHTLVCDFYGPKPNWDVPESSHFVDVSRQNPPAMETFFAWEKRRLVYNGFLTCLLLLLGASFSYVIHPARFARWSMMCLFAWNICYCVGPVLESYCVWIFKADRNNSRKWLFSGGLAFSLAVTGLILVYLCLRSSVR